MSVDMRFESFKHSLLSFNMDVCLYVCMYVPIFEAKYLGN